MMISKPILQGVLFDFNGTIVDTDFLHFECWNEALVPYNKTISAKFYSNYCAGLSTKQAAVKIASTFSIIGVLPDALAQRKDTLYATATHATPLKLMPGVYELINFLMQNATPMGLVSESSEKLTRTALEQHSIAHCFKTLVAGEKLDESEPLVQGYHAAIQNLGVDPGSTIALNDSMHGVKAAKAAGLLTCAIPQAFTRQQNFSIADLICTDLAHLSSYLHRQFHNFPII